MANRNYIISSHGGYDPSSKYTVPADVQIRFYVDDDQSLYDTEATSILNKLRNNQFVRYKGLAKPGERIYSYFCWAHNVKHAKAVYGPNGKVMKFRGVQQARPVGLGSIVNRIKLVANQNHPGDKLIVHWLCCTTRIRPVVTTAIPPLDPNAV